MIRINADRFSRLFWEIIFESADMLPEEKKNVQKKAAIDLEQLRISADYNTGSIMPSQSFLLFLTTLFFQPKRVLEIGTFIGRSTISMALAMESYCEDGEIFTCDASNEIEIPWNGSTKIDQFRKQSSTDMLSAMSGVFDFLFLDGRLVEQDLALLDNLIGDMTVIGLDDFEGMEKGVINLTNLKRLKKLQHHFLIYPADRAAMKNNGLLGRSVFALLVPLAMIQMTNQ